MRQKIASYALKRALPPALHPEGQRSQTFTGSVGRAFSRPGSHSFLFDVAWRFKLRLPVQLAML